MGWFKPSTVLSLSLTQDFVRPLYHWRTSRPHAYTRSALNCVGDDDALFSAGPGHGAPGVLAPVYLEGTYSEVYPDKSLDEEGLQRFFKQFSFPGHIGSHCTPETPGSIHEGGELGYVLSHACGAVFALAMVTLAKPGPTTASNSRDAPSPHRMPSGQVLTSDHHQPARPSTPTSMGPDTVVLPMADTSLRPPTIRGRTRPVWMASSVPDKPVGELGRELGVMGTSAPHQGFDLVGLHWHAARDQLAPGGGHDGIVFNADADVVELFGHTGRWAHIQTRLDGEQIAAHLGVAPGRHGRSFL